MFVRSCWVLFLAGLIFLPVNNLWAQNQNLIQNGDFGDGWKNWDRKIHRDAKVTWELATSAGYDYSQGLHVTSQTEKKSHRYGSLSQTVKVQPQTTYVISLWYRSKDAHDIWFGGGPKWNLRKSLKPNQDQWTQTQIFYTTKGDEKSFSFRINFDGKIQDIWIDDLSIQKHVLPPQASMTPLGKLGTQHLGVVQRVALPLQIDGRLNDWPSGDNAVHMPLGNQPLLYDGWQGADDLSADFQTAWDQSNFYLAVTVRDDQHDAIDGPTMWTCDSVQVAFGIDDAYGPGFGFSFSDGKSNVMQWFKTKAPLGSDHIQLAAQTQGHLTTYEIAIPWQAISDKRPERFRFNVVVNDGDGSNREGTLQWAPGIVTHKSIKKFAWMMLAPSDGLHLLDVVQDKKQYLQGEACITNAYVVNLSADQRAVTMHWEHGKEKLQLPAGSLLQWQLFHPKQKPGDHDVTIRMQDQLSKQTQTRTQVVSVLPISRERVLGGLQDIEQSLPALEQKIEQCAARQMAIEYERLDMAVLKRFVGYGQNDVAHDRVQRAEYVLTELQKIQQQLLQRLDALLAGQAKPLPVDRFAAGPIQIDQTGFVTQARNPVTSKTSTKPMNLLGYGHFDQVRKDVPAFGKFGANIIQLEIGPYHVVKAPRNENEPYHIDLGALNKTIIPYLEAAAQNNVAVNILLSPHYFPKWALQKWPHLKNYNGGFLKYTIDAPQARMIVEAYLRAVVPILKQYSALQSLCISNEPVYWNSDRDHYTRQLWYQYIKQQHGSIDQLNKLYSSDYDAFTSVPIPRFNTLKPTPYYYDYVVFNQQRFANWHRWMAGIVHELAPGIPIHSKIMVGHAFNRNQVMEGVDPEQFAHLGEINGCDSGGYYSGDSTPYLQKQMYYDLLNSLHRAPLFDSENHMIRDGDSLYIPQQAQHVRTMLWQGAIHGRSATTIWVWERTYDKHAFEGSILHRPDCVRVAGQSGLDLNRLQSQVRAFSDAPYAVRILYSIPAIVYDPDYLQTVTQVYRTLSLAGIKVGFTTGNQLGNSDLSLDQCAAVIVPNAKQVRGETLQAIIKYQNRGGKVIRIGSQSLSRDQYNHPFAGKQSALPGALLPNDAVSDSAQLLGQLPERCLPRYMVVDAASGNPLSDVEWRVAEYQGQWLINMTRYSNQTGSVHIVDRKDGHVVETWTDLIANRTSSHSDVALVGLTPTLLQISN